MVNSSPDYSKFEDPGRLQDDQKLLAKYTVGMRIDGEELALLKHYAQRRGWTHSHAARFICGTFLQSYKRKLEADGMWGTQSAAPSPPAGDGAAKEAD
jgi:hypothetical protein